MLTPPGVWLGRAAVAWNSALLVREVWYRFCSPGTFRALVRSAWASITTGQPFVWPSAAASPAGKAAGSGDAASFADPLRWYVSAADLEFFKDAVERDVGPAWEPMLQKEWEGCTYQAWRRMLPSGKSEYKSVTVSSNATAQEFMDFYLDDDVRPNWDGMIKEHNLLESSYDEKHRCQVVRWLRSFPFAFISSREYVIARRVFPGADPDTLYGITKGVEHPAAPQMPGVVRMNTFYSMWRSRTVPSPDGSDAPACETTLLHFEDFGIPEHLARFAVRHGMAGFVGKMVPYVKEFVAQRRGRCKPTGADPEAYGYNLTPLMRSTSYGSISAATAAGGTSATSKAASTVNDDSASERDGHVPRARSLRGLSYMLLASGVAIALSRTSSSNSLAGQSASRLTEAEVERQAAKQQQQRHGHRQHGIRVHHFGRRHGGHHGAKRHGAGHDAHHAASPLRSHRVMHIVDDLAA